MFIIIGGDGKEYGPVSAEKIREWIKSGRANLSTKAKYVGTEEWHTLGEYTEFVSSPPSAGGTNLPQASGGIAVAGQPEAIEFTGDWVEYFKIWIVNVLLTIVTLGIYAAWAKVRKRRYFHGNTRVFGHTFEYLADPLKILYGNLIVVGMFLIYSLSGAISPLLQLPFLLLFLIAVPWFIIKAYAFNARNTAWRGLRFAFKGTYGEAAMAYLLRPLLIPFTLGGIIPYVLKRQKEFVVTRHSYGATPFTFSARTGEFYKIYLITGLFFLPIIAAYLSMFGMLAAQAAKHSGRVPPGAAGAFGLIGMLMLIGLPLALVGSFYFRSRIFNLMWNNTMLAGHQFLATMRARDLFLIHFVNGLVTLVTLGLMQPWATVRLVKYQLSCIHISAAGNMDEFVAAAQPPVSAIGDAASGFFDFDLGFGL